MLVKVDKSKNTEVKKKEEDIIQYNIIDYEIGDKQIKLEIEFLMNNITSISEVEVDLSE